MAKPKKPKRDRAARTVPFAAIAAELAAIGRQFYARGWVFGTSGNFSGVISRDPMRLAITSTGLDKGALDAASFIEMDDAAHVVRGNGKPSAEALLHSAIVRELGAGAVLHTHSVWSTVLSGKHAARGGIEIGGYEMLKGLEGVRTHEHREWLPILENSQDDGVIRARDESVTRESRSSWIPFARAWALYLGSDGAGSQAPRGDFGVFDGSGGAGRGDAFRTRRLTRCVLQTCTR